MLKILKSSVSAAILSGVLLGSALAGEVKSIAILTPEEGTDYRLEPAGHRRRQGGAARPPASKWSWPRALAMATFVRRCGSSRPTAPAC